MAKQGDAIRDAFTKLGAKASAQEVKDFVGLMIQGLNPSDARISQIRGELGELHEPVTNDEVQALISWMHEQDISLSRLELIIKSAKRHNQI